VPGLAKTLLVKSVAEAMRLDFRRIQFTPDLVPSDITGSEVMEEDRAAGTRAFRFVEGPVFANVVLADEINRAPPRTQAALLEAMQEHAVSAAGRTMRLPEPFFVLATQNPIEQEGTYPLPEAQLDRFLFDVRVGYPGADDEVAILRATTGAAPAPLEPVIGADETLALQRLARMVAAGEPVLRYAAALVRATRPGDEGRRRSCAARCAGARARAPARRWCSAPRRTRCSPGATPWRPRTCARGRSGAAGTACCRRSPPSRGGGRRADRRRGARRRGAAALGRRASDRGPGLNAPRPGVPGPGVPGALDHAPLLDAVRALRWPARGRVGGTLPGAHRARLRGPGGEFSEYRAYRQGDDPGGSTGGCSRAATAPTCASPTTTRCCRPCSSSTRARRWRSPPRARAGARRAATARAGGSGGRRAPSPSGSPPSRTAPATRWACRWRPRAGRAGWRPRSAAAWCTSSPRSSARCAPRARPTWAARRWRAHRGAGWWS
jgi:hypothetical protein